MLAPVRLRSRRVAQCQVRDATDRIASLYSTSLNNSLALPVSLDSSHFSTSGANPGLDVCSAQNFLRASKSSNSISWWITWRGPDKGAKQQSEFTLLTKRVAGEVSGITKNFIAIVYSRDKERHTEEEIALPIAKGVKLVNIKSLNDIRVGDTMEVIFVDTQERYQERKEDGSIEEKTKVVKREAVTIRFIRRPIKGLYSP